MNLILGSFVHGYIWDPFSFVYKTDILTTNDNYSYHQEWENVFQSKAQENKLKHNIATVPTQPLKRIYLKIWLLKKPKAL